MEKINLRGIKESLSKKEMKHVLGGSGDSTGSGTGSPCPLITCSKTCTSKTGISQTYYVSCYGKCVNSADGTRVDCVPCNGPGDGGGYVQCINN